MSVPITIVIPTHNPGSKLLETLDSCLNQTFSNFEIVLISNHVHHAKINYAIKGLLNKFPYYIKFFGTLISCLIPNKLSIPFSLPDTKIIVAKKF